MKKDIAIRLQADQLSIDAYKATSFEELTRITKQAEELERNHGSQNYSTAEYVSSTVELIRRLETTLMDDYDAHPFSWIFTEAMQRIVGNPISK